MTNETEPVVDQSELKKTPHAFKLTRELSERVASLASDLNVEAQEHQEEWEERSEAWQDGEKGSAVSAWIETLAELVDTLEAFEDKP